MKEKKTRDSKGENMTRSWRRGKERDRDSDHREGRRKET